MRCNPKSIFNLNTQANSLIARLLFVATLMVGLAGTAAAQQADVSIQIIGPANTVAGDLVTYNVAIGNAGPNPANGTSYAITFAPPLPGGFVINCAGNNGAAACPAPNAFNGNSLAGVLQNLPPNSLITFQMGGRIPPTNQQPIAINANVVGPGGPQADPNPANDQAVINVAVPVTLQQFSVD